jgi:hypothetical protein
MPFDPAGGELATARLRDCPFATNRNYLMSGLRFRWHNG